MSYENYTFELVGKSMSKSVKKPVKSKALVRRLLKAKRTKSLRSSRSFKLSQRDTTHLIPQEYYDDPFYTREQLVEFAREIEKEDREWSYKLNNAPKFWIDWEDEYD